MLSRPFRPIFLALTLALLVVPVHAGESSARTAVHLLDYIAQDYRGAVRGGAVISEEEYAEMREFSRAAMAAAAGDPLLARDAAIQHDAARLVGMIDAKATPELVAQQALSIKRAIIERTHLAVAPDRWPNLEQGRTLYQQACAACHGASGHGDGPIAASLDPHPTNFHDPSRMVSLAPFQAFNTIRLGVSGTAMPAFGGLTDRQTWALAFYIVSLRYQNAPVAGSQTTVPLDVAASKSDREILDSTHDENILPATRLRSGGVNDDTLSAAIELLREADRRYARGDRAGARAKALSAYLDGVEPAEPRIRALAPALVSQLERELGGVRNAIESRDDPRAVSAAIDRAINTIRHARSALDTPASRWFIVSMAAAIVLREAFEAILIIVAILSVLRAVGAQHAARWVHAGWISALVAGLLAWGGSDAFLRSSAVDRELLEAVTSLLAVVVLLYMGFWLHRRTEIARWKKFVEEKITTTLDSGRLFGLAVISFVAVFREVLETVLFLVAVSLEGGAHGRTSALTGAALALVASITLAWLLVRFSVRLPLRTMFSTTAVLLMVLGVILAGKAVHALQEGGVFRETFLPVRIHLDLLGVYPTIETLVAQLIIVACACILWLRARAPRPVSN